MIELWYGDQQSFGDIGLPQRWINILGNISEAQGIRDARFRLNDSKWIPLSIGPDFHRLAKPGDINIELPLSRCREGENTILIRVDRNKGSGEETQIPLVVRKTRKWPLPWRVDFGKDTRGIDQVQICDGLWKEDDWGLTTLEPYYDRVIAFGDRTWENYSVEARIVFRGINLPGPLDGGRSVIHIGMALRWQGHDQDRFHPHRKWYPLGVTAEFRLDRNCSRGSWRMLTAPKERLELEEKRGISIDRPYRIKGEVFDVDKSLSRYRMKLWDDGEQEPERWDIQMDRPKKKAPSGSALLVAHYSRVSILQIETHPK